MIPGGGSLTGVLVATAAGAGAGHVALDSEQVACPFQAAPENIVIDKTASTRSARPGDLITYRIRVTNRGHAPVRGLRACDRAPRALRFVRSRPHVRRAGGRLRCLTIRVLRPGAHRTFHATFRLRANVTTDIVNNGAIAETPSGGAAGESGSGKRRQRIQDRDGAAIGVRFPESRGCASAASVPAHAAC